ncbi:MAG: tetratricopeptide repeat protein [Anaerolineales bacterium]|nr:tetratricopeptide repeat protein [Anaerolineales bacterium]
MNRTDLLQLLDAALAAGQPAFARQTAQRYLADWPGDLAVHFALGRAYAAEGRPSHSIEALLTVVTADPEAAAVWRALADQHLTLGNWGPAIQASGLAHVCDGQGVRGPLPDWAASGRASYLAGRIGDWATAAREAAAARRAAPGAALLALLELAVHWHAGQLDLARPLAQTGSARWPQAVAFRLCLAECLIATNDHPGAIALLHDAAAQDLGEQVVTRHWGNQHAYRALWNNTATAALPGPMPAELIALLGLNRLEGQGASTSGRDPGAHAAGVEEIAQIQSRLDELAGRLPSGLAVKYRLRHLKQTERRSGDTQPRGLHYIWLSSRTRLTQVFGPAGFGQIDVALHHAASQVRRQSGLRTAILYVDDPSALSPFGLRPVNPANAWDVKTLIGKLVARLKQDRDAIGALLIVGGGDIIPFHHLPNPTDDADPDIPSDNPYATSDENYFVPEWPIGRLPTGAGSQAAPLLRQIHALSGAPPRSAAPAGLDWLARLRLWFREQWLRRLRRPSFGYSANVWRSASAAVYNQIGDPRELLTSPPLDANGLPLEGLVPSRFSYFNLHGIEDGPEWYGQRSFEDPGSMPEYPVALRPADVANSGRAPLFVFSEACYGANIVGKQTDEALCLKFLDSGSRVVVGSTKIAYGSVTTPLVGADLLGRCFWQNLTNGVPAAEALRRAKLQMAQEMQQRQGFLDGEDQKTLISFVLYGDPLAVSPEPGAQPKSAPAALSLAGKPPAPCTVCDKTSQPGPPGGSVDVTPEMVSQIKAAVARYLPGMEDARVQVARSQSVCQGTDHACPTAQLSRRAKQPARVRPLAATVVTLSKTIRTSARRHPHYARLTLDDQGVVVKVAVSR